jgi:hypothetical protein
MMGRVNAGRKGEGIRVGHWGWGKGEGFRLGKGE